MIRLIRNDKSGFVWGKDQNRKKKEGTGKWPSSPLESKVPYLLGEMLIYLLEPYQVTLNTLYVSVSVAAALKMKGF